MKIFVALASFFLMLNPNGAFAAQNWESWLNGVKAEARQKGISEGIISQALNGIKPIPQRAHFTKRTRNRTKQSITKIRRSTTIYRRTVGR